ncbi:zinc finger CCCH domain-containing protein 13-like isoform X1 [Pomacea canaliculata]|uniref:zinc finger CCCH domain-containing protein 13-like isoform X1 n=1 Tax=Pomacea canaliculata TaxID=400727 RepID=UPI000D739F78|nr:zinc finger CCCH domain-containing protein 13-like isoform X1 [Pomacea canaliculata]
MREHQLELFDGSPGTYITGLQKKVCGREEDMPKDMFFVYKNFLILRVEANGVIMGSGFRIHFTRYRITIPCSRDEFMCETFGRTRCIANHLVCDDWNDCGDWVDEEQYCDRLTGGAIAGVVLAAVFFVGLFVFLVIWFCKCRNSDSGADEEKDADFMMRLRNPDASEISKSSNIGTMAPFGVSSESMERQEYAPRYSKGQSGSRGRLSRSQDLSIPEHDDAPPPYVEKGRYVDDSRSDGASDVFEDSRPRSRRKSNGRARNNDDIDEEEEMEPPRMRRPRSRSQEDRLNARPAEVEAVAVRPVKEEVHFVARPDDRYAARKSGRDSPPEDDRYPRNGRYPPRRDEWEPEYDDRYPPRDDRRQSSGRDDRDRRDRRDDRDPRDRRDDRDPRDRRDDRDPRDRRDDRDPRDRRDERDPRDRRSQRDPRDRRSFPRDASDEDDDPSSVRDSLHPLREKRKSLQDLGTDDERRSRGGRSGDERSIPASEDEFPPPPSQWEEPPPSRRRPDARAATPPPPRAARDDSLDSDQDEREPPRVRHSQRPTTVTPTSKAPPATAKPSPAPAPVPVPSPASASVTSDIAPDDPPQRRRRRRSRSREGREGGNRPSRGDEVPPVVLRDYDDEDDDPHPYKIRGASYREEAV